MEGDYLELSQFSYNSHQFSYNSNPSPLGTTGSLTIDIRAINSPIVFADRHNISVLANTWVAEPINQI